MRKLFFHIFLSIALFMSAADPMATTYTYSQCHGSLCPYPEEVNPAVYPDSLTPIFINHVGRHGSRYPASAASCTKLRRALFVADSLGTITPTGRKLYRLVNEVIAASSGRWGALDSLGEAEQRAIASRLFINFKPLFQQGKRIDAISSYSPRSMMSMFAFIHQLSRLNNHVYYTTSSGRENSPLVRPFDLDTIFQQYLGSELWAEHYNHYFATACPTSAITRALGERFPFESDEQQRDLAITEYYVVAGCRAMSLDPMTSQFFTTEEYNALWSCFNLRQYLQRTATTVSVAPADIAAELLRDIVATFDAAADGSDTVARLRFGHAETLLPLLSLIRLQGCFYATNYFDTVAQHWRDFDIVPMAANLQMILFRSASGRLYLRVDLNERPVSLIPNNNTLYLPWDEARKYLLDRIPLYL